MDPTAISERIAAAYRSGEPFAAAPEDGPADRAAAYAAQTQVMACLGAVGGWKTGRKTLDEAVIMAPIRASTVIANATPVPPDETRLCGAELEIGFRLEAEPPAPDDPRFEALLRERVVALPCFEIVESRLEDPEAAGAHWKLADNQLNGGLVLGAPVADWRESDLARRRVRLAFGDKVVWDGPAETPGGDAFATYIAFARAVGDHCGGLREGQVVITGSLTGLLFASQGDQIEGEIEGMSRLTTRFS